MRVDHLRLIARVRERATLNRLARRASLPRFSSARFLLEPALQLGRGALAPVFADLQICCAELTFVEPASLLASRVRHFSFATLALELAAHLLALGLGGPRRALADRDGLTLDTLLA